MIEILYLFLKNFENILKLTTSKLFILNELMVKSSVRLLSVVIGLFIGIFLILQQPSIKKDLLIWSISKILNEPKHTIVMDTVEGILPFSVHIPTFEIHDEKGAWLQLRDFTLKLSWFPFFKIEGIKLESLTVNHKPTFESASVNLQDILPWILSPKILTQGHINFIHFAPDLLGRSYSGNLRIRNYLTTGQSIKLESSEGSIETVAVLTNTNQIDFTNLKLNYQDWRIQGDASVKTLHHNLSEAIFTIQLAHSGLQSPLPVSLGIHYDLSQKSIQVSSRIDLNTQSFLKDFFGPNLTSSFKILKKGDIYNVESLKMDCPLNHELKGNGLIDLKTKTVKGKLTLNLSRKDSPFSKMEANLEGTFENLRLSIKNIKTKDTAILEWKKDRQDFTVKTQIDQLSWLNGCVYSLKGEAHFNALLTGKAQFEIKEGHFNEAKFGKSIFTMTLNQGHGIYQFDSSANLNGSKTMFSSKGNLSFDKDYPSIAGDIFIKTFISRSKKKSGQLSLKNVEINSKFSWNTNNLRWQSINQPTASMPLHLKGFMELDRGRISLDKPCHIIAQGQFNLSSLMPWITNGDRISGKVLTDLTLTGSINNPLFQGELKAQNGSYEIAEFGTYIGDINLQMKARGSTLEIKTLTFSDGTKKSVPYGKGTGVGSIDLRNLLKPFFNIDLTVNDFQVAANDSLFLQAKGKVRLKGIGKQAAITGDIELNAAKLSLEEVNPIPSIPKIHIIDTNTKKVAAKAPKTQLKIFPIHLKLKTPKRFIICGFGLDSLWEGEIEVIGYLSDPQLIGSIHVVKGKIDLLGKIMKLTKGQIRYENGSSNNPQLYIIATREIDGVSINLIVEGFTSSPRFTFLSAPAMAEEEILSRLLFGKELNKISVGQSLQLASAVASINGQKGLNVMDKIRDSFGLNVLEIKENTNDADGNSTQAVSIGKEFGNVRISLDQTLTTGSSKASVSTALTPNLNLDIDIGGSQSSGVGISWVKRY